jgi:pimeloyl-ACP methyl ester carboxylesterase
MRTLLRALQILSGDSWQLRAAKKFSPCLVMAFLLASASGQSAPVAGISQESFKTIDGSGAAAGTALFGVNDALQITRGYSAAQAHGAERLVNRKPSLRVPRALGLSRMPKPGRSLGPPHPPANASPDIIWVHCPQEAHDLGGMCGKLPVPLDRQHPQGKKIKIYFELYLHTNPGPAESAFLANSGGPSQSTHGNRGAAFALFGQDFDVHDLLLIDDRGRGFSAPIDCEEIQHGTASFAQAEADCAAQLGDAASWYGTGDVAKDTDAVRAALGYDKVDYWGGSYGGIDVTAYATRFGEHLRSIIMDSPDGTPGLRAFSLDGNEARATSREIRLDCQRSPTCSMDHPDPDAELDQLIQAIRSKPLQGYAYDASGNLIQVRLDEGALLHLAIYPTGQFVGTGELLAAADSLSHDDPAPLLRLGAEVPPLVTDFGDPTEVSQGDYYAAFCVDLHQPWDWSESLSERKEQFADAVADLPSDHFAPFSKAAGASLSVSLEKQCLWWEKPTPSAPVVPPHATYPNVPTLVLDGDMDTLVPMEEARKVAALFPGSTFVPVAEAGHVTLTQTQCSVMLQVQFFETLQVGDTSCAQTPETVWPALGRFPLIAADARPAEVDPNGGNQIGEAERKVVTVAVATAIDALKRTTIGSVNGVGLRAGTFQTGFDPDGNQITTLTNCSFANDVTVNGTVTWGAALSFAADLTVSGTGTAGGTLHIEGTWEAPGPVGDFKVSGTLGGQNVAVLVPEA